MSNQPIGSCRCFQRLHGFEMVKNLKNLVIPSLTFSFFLRLRREGGLPRNQPRAVLVLLTCATIQNVMLQTLLQTARTTYLLAGIRLSKLLFYIQSLIISIVNVFVLAQRDTMPSYAAYVSRGTTS